MQRLSEFIAEHIDDNPVRLALKRDSYPEIDMNAVLETLLSRDKIRKKLPHWYAEPRLILPFSLSAEQCSSWEMAEYKAKLIKRLRSEICTTAAESFADCSRDGDFRIADLTGGLGVDCSAFASVSTEVLYNEMSTKLCDCVRYNFKTLGVDNCIYSNKEVRSGNVSAILNGFKASLIYLDPARRSSSGNKVFLIEDCSPDVAAMKEELLENAPLLLIKLSPMADISMVISRMGKGCKELHICGTARECKEVLLLIDRDYDGECRIVVDSLSFTLSEQRSSVPVLAQRMPGVGDYLFEPSKVLMKAAPFNLISSDYALEKIGRFTHVYMRDNALVSISPSLLRCFEVLEAEPLTSGYIKSVGKRYPKAEVVSHNTPLSSEALCKKLSCRPGEEYRIFALHHDFLSCNILVVTRKK